MTVAPNEVWIGYLLGAAGVASGTRLSAMTRDERLATLAVLKRWRVGIVGELYMNFGVAGVIVGMFVFGLLIALADRRLRHAGPFDAAVPFWCVVSLVGMFATVGMLNMFTSSVMLFGGPLLVAAMVAARRVPAAPAPVPVT